MNQVGLPPEGIALIKVLDQLPDMIRTAVNIMVIKAVSIIVAKSGRRSMSPSLNDPAAGEKEGRS
ncbi:dicarboxylate/amino acid:cation symporter [Vibrio chagasii]|nr:dicarboxylate/amino acid:cation symporter [Vibrio chagasii]